MTASPPILVVLGTKAQFIKTAPVLREMDARQLPYRLVYTGQHCETFDQLEKSFETRAPDEVLVPKFEAADKRRFATWLVEFSWKAAKQLASGSWRGTQLGVVHGDTASTLAGAIVIRLLGARVCHVEAGLRSERLLDPFPEEIVRRLTSLLTSIHFAPDSVSKNNLSRAKGRVINTSGNTLRDSLSIALAVNAPLPATSDGGYAVVSIHRNENLTNIKDFNFLMNLAMSVSDVIPVKFVLHPATREKIAATGWIERLHSKPSLELLDRMDYMDFIPLLLHSNMLLTDGGSNQEEAAMLGLPTLLLRRTTERNDGLGDNILLSNLDPGIIDSFVHTHRRKAWSPRSPSGASPSKLIVDALEAELVSCCEGNAPRQST